MKDPAFLFYPNDYIGGTMGMTFEEKGAYMELLMMQFNRGHMTEHMIRQTVGQLWDVIKDKFAVDDEGMFYNIRLQEEKTKRQKFTESRRNNKSGNNQHSKKPKKHIGHTTKDKTEHMENENENINKDIINIEFEVFWNLYDKKVGDKKACKKKWVALKDEDRNRIIESLPIFKSSISEKKYLPYPATYLNQNRWNDEYSEASTSSITERLNNYLTLQLDEKRKLQNDILTIPVMERTQREQYVATEKL